MLRKVIILQLTFALKNYSKPMDPNVEFSLKNETVGKNAFQNIHEKQWQV